ncbi:MAG: stage II sporulation protein R, partial [Clostridia bacterium]|nr:stage II sporulation protein R [Clostridia bacterium]
MKKYNIKILERSLLFALVFSVLLSFAKFNVSCDTLRNNILRIHIIANSDSDADQTVKLKVRDAILEYTKDIFKDCSDLETAEKSAKNNLKKIGSICNKTLAENGFSYKASAKTGKAFFDTREYETF